MSSRGHVLLVEDDEASRGMFEAALRFGGFTVDSSASGAGALTRLRAGSFDLAVLDLGLPGISGPEVLEAMQRWAATAQMPVIVVTGAAVHQRDLNNPRIVSVLHKPVDPSVLVDAVFLALQARAPGA